MFVCLKPSWNSDSRNPQQHRDWHRCVKVNDIICDKFCLAETSAGVLVDSTYANDGATAFTGADLLQAAALAPGATSAIGQIVPDSCIKELKTIDSLSVTAHGISIHDNFPEAFFNAYVPFHYGGPAIVTPDDEGALMINFALFPRSYQPSGHLNVSRAREFFLSWTTSYVTSSTPADLVAIAIAINFLLITDGSAVLRYST
jgi:hypothetical protein